MLTVYSNDIVLEVIQCFCDILKTCHIEPCELSGLGGPLFVESNVWCSEKATTESNLQNCVGKTPCILATVLEMKILFPGPFEQKLSPMKVTPYRVGFGINEYLCLISCQ